MAKYRICTIRNPFPIYLIQVKFLFWWIRYETWDEAEQRYRLYVYDDKELAERKLRELQ